jgi:ABC-type lipoprotein export system ATPase subunit/ABC-type antimicrobial peptide transport system permease subunit
MLLIRNLNKTYRTNDVEVNALSDVGIAFPERGMVFVLGKSGSGKSTLLNLIAGFDVPDGGDIFIDGKNLGRDADFDDYRNNLIGFIFQEFNLNKSLNAEQNILLSERLRRGAADEKKTEVDKAGNQPSERSRRSAANAKKAEESLLAVGLKDKAKKKVNRMSGGEQQRVAIARALIKEPRLILADEPTGKLDETNGKIIFDILKKLSEKILVVVVSHDRESAEKYADRIIELSDGKILSDKVKNPRYIAETTVKDDGTYLLQGRRLSQNDLDILNENKDKKIVLSKETKFVKRRGAAPPIYAINNGNGRPTPTPLPRRGIAENDSGKSVRNNAENAQNINGSGRPTPTPLPRRGIDENNDIIAESNDEKSVGNNAENAQNINESGRPTPTPLSRRGIAENDKRIAENNDGIAESNDGSGRPAFAPLPRRGIAENTKNNNEKRTKSKAEKAKNKGLRLSDIFFLAYKNLTSRIFKTLSTILICVVMFATLGLSAVIVLYDEYQAAAHTFVKNGESDVVVRKKNGGKMSGGDADYLKNNYPEGYLELYPLFGFDFPDYLAQSDTDNLTAITGVFEMEESDLSKLGYTLMNFTDVPNIFAYLSEPPQNLSPSDLPDGVLNSPSDILNFYIFARLLSENSDVIEYIDNNPGLLDELQNNPNFIEDLENDPDLPEILKDNPEFWAYLRENPQILEYTEYLPENILNGVPDWLNPSAPLPDGVWDNPQFGGIPGIENAETVGDLLILLLNNNDSLSFQSRFPTTSLPAAEYAGGLELNEIVITDFLAYLVMRRLGDFLSPYYKLNIPTEGEELRAFLHGGFEAVLVDCFNKLNSISGFSPLRVVGVLDTGYKEKYFKYVEDPSYSVDVEYLNYVFKAENYYLQLYAAKGFSKNCYHGRLLTETFHFSTEQSGILADYLNGGLVVYAEDYIPAALADNEMILTENAFIHLFGAEFGGNPKIYNIQNAVDGILFKNYKVVGVIKNAAAENLFEKDFGAVLSEKGFAETVNALGALSAARVSIEADQASALFSYMKQNGLMSVSVYSRILSYIAPTIDNLKTVFLPVAILIALIALTAMPMFLVTAVTKKQKDIGVMKALGMKTRDVIKIHFVESAATVISVLILSSLAVGLVFDVANTIIAGAVERFLSPEWVKLVVLLYITELPYIINIASILVIGVASVIYPTVKISRLSPIAAMKKE